MEVLNSQSVREFVIKRGIPLSGSKLFKLSAKNLIPHRKAGGRLIFYSDEILEWCESQIINPSDTQLNRSIFESAQSKSKIK